MNIKSYHVLELRLHTPSRAAFNAAVGLVELGARSLSIVAEYKSAPLPEGANIENATINLKATSDDETRLESYFNELSRALAFIGVEVADA